MNQSILRGLGIGLGLRFYFEFFTLLEFILTYQDFIGSRFSLLQIPVICNFDQYPQPVLNKKVE